MFENEHVSRPNDVICSAGPVAGGSLRVKQEQAIRIHSRREVDV